MWLWLGLGLWLWLRMVMVVMTLGRSRWIRGVSLVWFRSWMVRFGLAIALLPAPPCPPVMQLLVFVVVFSEQK